MKILMLSQGLPFPIYLDGLTVRVYHLLNEFSKNAQCHLIAFSDYDLTEQETAQLDAMASYDIIKREHASGIAGTMRKALSPHRYLDERFKEKVSDAVKHFQPDIVFAEQTFMSQYVDVLRDIPKVMSAVDAISLAALRQSKIGRSLTNYLSWRYVAYQRLTIEKRYFPKFDEITAVAEIDARFLRENLNLEVGVVPNGVDTDFFCPTGLDANRKSILFSGNLNAPMNEEACLYLLEKVFPEIHASHPELDFQIAGRNATAAIHATIPPYVTLMEDIPDMRDALRKSLLFVSPIAYGTGIKNNVLQAMAMGIPVVVTPQIAEPVGIEQYKNGIIADRDVGFIQGIKLAIGDDKIRGELARAGREHIEQCFSWQHVAQTYLEMFDKIRKTNREN